MRLPVEAGSDRIPVRKVPKRDSGYQLSKLSSSLKPSIIQTTYEPIEIRSNGTILLRLQSSP